MRRNYLLFPIAILTATIGCNDPKTISKSNLEDGLNHSLARNVRCVEMLDANGNDQLFGKPIQDESNLDALVAAGWLSKSPAASGNGGEPQFTYNLTGKGKGTKTQVAMDRGGTRTGFFCDRKEVVDQIIGYTEPADEHGVHETHVTFTTKLEETPDWLQDPSITKAFPYLQLPATGPDRHAEAVMQLTSEGWRSESDRM